MAAKPPRLLLLTKYRLIVTSNSDEGSIAAPAAENTASAEMEAREELLEETTANNEGMPEAQGDEGQKAAVAGE